MYLLLLAKVVFVLCAPRNMHHIALLPRYLLLRCLYVYPIRVAKYFTFFLLLFIKLRVLYERGALHANNALFSILVFYKIPVKHQTNMPQIVKRAARTH